VPAHDGSERFNLKAIDQLPALTQELPQGHPVLVTFTVSTYEMSKDVSSSSSPSKYSSPKKVLEKEFRKVI
jgi:hypothetical protein